MKDSKNSSASAIAKKATTGKDSIEKGGKSGLKNVQIDPRFSKEDEKRRVVEKEKRKSA